MIQTAFNHLLILMLGVIFSFYSYSQMNQNNLNLESSTYLLQHAKNPINWQRWNKKLYHSKNTDEKLLIVSIGYLYIKPNRDLNCLTNELEGHVRLHTRDNNESMCRDRLAQVLLHLETTTSQYRRLINKK